MRDIYLIDFENVASEGLSGITYLSEEDQVIIFYSNNSNRLTMKMHILIGKSVCKLDYFEVTVGGKNALDHQISTWLGYLIGTGAAERNYYIVSRDMGYKHVANFWAGNEKAPKVRCVDTIKAASRLDRSRRDVRETVLQAMPQGNETAAETPEIPAEEPVVTAAQLVPITVQLPEVSAEETDAVKSMAAESLPEAREDAEEAPEQERVEVDAAEASSKKNYRGRAKVRRSRSRNHVREVEAAGKEPEATEVQASVEETPKAEKQPQKPSARQNRDKTAEQKQSGNLDQLAVMIAPYPKLQESVLRDLIANNKRQILCNTLRKHLGQEKGLALYNEIKKAAWH